MLGIKTNLLLSDLHRCKVRQMFVWVLSHPGDGSIERDLDEGNWTYEKTYLIQEASSVLKTKGGESREFKP